MGYLLIALLNFAALVIPPHRGDPWLVSLAINVCLLVVGLYAFVNYMKWASR